MATLSTRLDFLFFSFYMFDYALKKKSRAWMRDCEREVDEWESDRAPARVDRRVTEAM